MQYFPIFLLMVIGLTLITRPFTVLLHELGHAIPAILLTKRKVTMFIGSHGDPKKSVKINLGILVIFFRYNPFAWRLGLCVPSADMISLNQQIVYTMTGPLASLIVGGIACYFTFAYDLHGLLKLFLIVFIGSAFVDLLVNLIPIKTPIKLYDGSITYNDGYNLKLLFYLKRLPREYAEAVDLYKKQRFGDAGAIFEKILLRDIEDEHIYRWAINSYLQDKNYTKSKDLYEKLALTGKMNSVDLSNLGFCYLQLGSYEKAIEVYEMSLQQDKDNKNSLNSRGYILNLMNKFEEAVVSFDKAIDIDKDYAYPYNNRGFAKIKLGLTQEGLQDIKHSLLLDQNNSYAYRNLGIYHFNEGDYDEALRLFVKSKDLDETTHMIVELIEEAKRQIERRQWSDSTSKS